MQVERMKVAPDTVAYADGEHHKLIVEFAIPGAPTETIDVKILEDSVYLLAPARDIKTAIAQRLLVVGGNRNGGNKNRVSGNDRWLRSSSCRARCPGTQLLLIPRR